MSGNRVAEVTGHLGTSSVLGERGGCVPLLQKKPLPPDSSLAYKELATVKQATGPLLQPTCDSVTLVLKMWIDAPWGVIE